MLKQTLKETLETHSDYKSLLQATQLFYDINIHNDRLMNFHHHLFNLKKQQELFPSVPILQNKKITQFLMQ
jgi:hypothetical protein